MTEEELNHINSIKETILEDFLSDPIKTFEMMFKVCLDRYKVSYKIPKNSTLTKAQLETNFGDDEP